MHPQRDGQPKGQIDLNSNHSLPDDPELSEIEHLKVKIDDLKKQVEHLENCLNQKDVFIESQDAKIKTIEQELNDMIRLENDAQIKEDTISAYQTQNSLLHEEILQLNGLRCDRMARRAHKKSVKSGRLNRLVSESSGNSVHGEEAESTLVNDIETPDSRTSTWEERIASLKNDGQLT